MVAARAEKVLHAATIRRAVDLDLTSEQREIQRLAREFATAEVMPAAEELDREKRFPYEIVERLGGLGLMGVPYPQEYGGGGADTLSYALVVEELGRADQSVGITVAAHTSLGTWPIYAFGSDAQREQWLPDLCGGRRLGAFGLTEPEAGSDAGNTRTTARLDDGEWTIDGAKQFITNAGTDVSGCVTVTARTGDDEVSNLIVPAGTPGYEVGEPYRKMGWNASDTRPLAFDSVRVPEENLLGPRGAGFRQFLQTLDGGRISVSALAKDAGRTFSLTAAQAKLKTGRLAVRAAEEAVQIHGGYGYIEEYPVCRFYRDAKILTIGEGTDEVQQMVIARALGA